MTIDIDSLRSHFPSLDSGIAHFDSPGGTQTPRQVGAAIAETLTGPLSYRGHGVSSESNAEEAIAGFRHAYADLLGVASSNIVYGRSATQLTYDFSRTLAKQWNAGDEVVISRLDHDANIRPWIQAAQGVGARVRWIEFDPQTAQIDPDSVRSAITDRTRLVAITAASNLLGTIPDVRSVADQAHAVDALVYVDGVHYTAHQWVDVTALGADFFTCSPYKFLGPHCAVLASASATLLESLRPDKLLPSTNAVPERFELGTLPYEIMAGATAAVDFLADLAPAVYQTGGTDSAGIQGLIPRRERLRAALHAIDEHETRLRTLVEEGLATFGPQVLVHSRAANRTATLLLSLPGRSCRNAYLFLSQFNVLAPAGSFYAYEPFRTLGLDDEHALRIGIAPYNNDDDIARLLDGINRFLSR
jgi:cysteine desulfurase family protein (TIGR01976 family)